ncbi:MAG: molybdopterin-dependent oxidoreductase [Proteobacteria bacterium]|nr:molybdopterin-dependent oxidoreductase [Pseudomonadota bacterium]
MTKEKTIQITIDNRKIAIQPNFTVLQAARMNNIFIPSLCTLEHLPSYGACRLCVVEVDGLRGFPTSCTTPVEDGMVIRTDTAEIRSLRQEVLKLLLSEHPASCLFCTEQDECKDFQGTIRKVGVTTGCRYCPNDNRCELQQITESIGLTETSYPVYYRGFTVEKNDPFYDRDYNLCILCGRCVRVCNSVRMNGTLSFKQRGRLTTIGPAFDRTHLESGCEFCGACVSACPTGALSVKVSKWYGKPDTQVATTCNYCAVGCKLQLQVKNNEVIDVLPDYDSAIDHGLLCVKGRFAVPEYVHSPLRYGVPMEMTPMGYNDISWDQAISSAADKLKGVKPEDCMFLVSPQLSNEDLFLAQKFIRSLTGSENIASSLMIELGDDLDNFLDLALGSESIDIIEAAQGILTVGFDALYGYSPIGINIKKAAQTGASLAVINSVDTNLDLLSEAAFQTDETQWVNILEFLIAGIPKRKQEKGTSGMNKEWGSDIEKVSRHFAASSKNVVVVGEGVIHAPGRGAILQTLIKMRNKYGWKTVVAHPYTNLKGMLAMGAFPGVMPGEVLNNAAQDKSVDVKVDLAKVDLKKRKKVIYLIGETSVDALPACDFLIYQNALPLPSSRLPDLILPVSLFPESEGTLINGEGRILSVKKAIEPYMESRPDWWIFKSIAEKMGKNVSKYKDVPLIQNEIKKYVKGFLNLKKRLEFVKIIIKGSIVGSGKGKGISTTPAKSSYRGILLADIVGGMKVIESESYDLSSQGERERGGKQSRETAGRAR